VINLPDFYLPHHQSQNSKEAPKMPELVGKTVGPVGYGLMGMHHYLLRNRFANTSQV